MTFALTLWQKIIIWQLNTKDAAFIAVSKYTLKVEGLEVNFDKSITYLNALLITLWGKILVKSKFSTYFK